MSRGFVALCVALFLISVSGLQAQNVLAPDIINYQGTLVDADGVPLAGPTFDLEIRIYDTATSGTGALMWGPQEFDGEAGTGHGPLVPTTNGRFNLILGPQDTASNPLIEALQAISTFGGTSFLEIRVDGATLGPRQQMLSVPFVVSAADSPPPGTIVMWRGPPPRGWVLCNGTFGTPDLRNRFIKGAASLGSHFALGFTTHAHSMVPHSHLNFHTHNRNHSHSMFAHSHTVDPPNTTSSFHDPANTGLSSGGLSTRTISHAHSHSYNVGAFVSSAAGVFINFASLSTGGASVTTTGSSGGANSSALNAPPFFTLTFVMKL